MRRWLALLVVALACVGLLIAPRLANGQPTPSTIPPCENPPPLPITLEILPPCPQPGDTVWLRATSPCAGILDLQGISHDDSAGWVVRSTSGPLDRLDLIDCPVPDVEIAPLGVFVAGHHQLVVTKENVVTDDSTGTSCIIREQSLVSFVVGDCPPPSDSLCVNPPPLPIALETWPTCPQPADTVWLRATSPCAACLDLQGIHLTRELGWVVSSTSGPLELCDRVRCPMPDVVATPLGVFAAGSHSILVTKDNWVTDSTGATCLIREQSRVSFDVGADCPPPPTDSLQYVDRVEIGTAPCDTCPPVVCAGQPIPVTLGGVIRHSCYRFRRVELVPTLPTVIGPPVVRVIFGLVDCFETPCLQDSTPWQSTVLLPSLPAGGYRLRVESAIMVNCGPDSTLTVTGAESFRFQASDCGPPPHRPCLWLAWLPQDSVACDATIRPGGTATLPLGMRATVPIAGFQGRLFLSSLGLRVVDIRAIDYAQGMRVVWNLTPEGASFVLFSETGQLLPPCNPKPACPACCLFSPVLEVTVAAADSIPVPPVTQMAVWEVFGADSLGHGVPFCLDSPEDRLAMIARICAEHACDANGDGLTDIRDLVTMVNCLNAPGGCAADSMGTPYDCEHDGDFDLADVICCAHVLLHGQMPDSAETVPAPDVFVRFGEPVRTTTGVDVPIRVYGGSRLSAARLGLTIPHEHFDVTGLTVEREAAAWLALHEEAFGEVALGLIRIAGTVRIPEDPGTLELTLHLALKPGGTVAGQLWLSDGDFTGAEGEALLPGPSDRSVVLGVGTDPTPLALAPPHPNPATRDATLELSLDRDADVELTLHDLAGRRIATVHRGRLDAGPHRFTWAGGRDDGGVAANGLYFVRAKVGSRVLTQKLALLRGR